MLEDTKLALKVLGVQIFEELLTKDKEKTSIACALVPEWEISHEAGILSIKGASAISSEPKKPPWLDYVKNPDDESFEVFAEVDPYLNDFFGVILESWRVALDKSELSAEESLREAMLKIAERWKMSGDPLPERKQKELIGELACVADAYQIRGVEAIDSWDITGHGLYDLDSEGWIIESKATSSDPEAVILSSPEQVDFRVKKTLVLGVTRLNSSKSKGGTFPENVREIISDIPKVDRAKLELGLMNRGYTSTPEMDKKYTIRWIVHGTRYLRITEESSVIPCEWLDDRPDTITKITQRINTTGFPDSELETLIGG